MGKRTTSGSISSLNRWLIVLFFLSGFSALVYQVAWQRMLGLFAGSDVRSATIVVSAYLAGLAVGSMLGSFCSDRIGSRGAARMYGLSSLGIAAFAFFSKLLFYDTLFVRGHALSSTPGGLLLIAFISLLWPTVLMGLSLPLVSRAAVRTIDDAPALISRLTGINILGAAAGALLAGFVLVGNLGYDRTVYVGGGMNALVGIGALVLAARFPINAQAVAQGSEEGKRKPLRSVPRRVWIWCGLVVVSGFMAISLEIIWLRILGSLMQATPYLFATILFCFLAADGAGTLLGVRWAQRSEDPRRTFMLLQSVLALYALISIWGISSLSTDGLPGLLRRMAPLLMVFVPALIIGIAYPFVQKAIQTDLGTIGQRVSLIQTGNIVGNVAAGLLTGLVLLHFFGSATALRLIGLMGMAFAAVLWMENRSAGRSAWHPVSVGLLSALGLAVLAFPSSKGLWARVYGASRTDPFFSAEDSTGEVIVKQQADRFVMYSQGLHQGEFPATDPQTLLGLIPALTHPEPKSVLVIGLGSGVTAYSVGANPQAESILVAEIITAEFRLLDTLVMAGIGEHIDSVLNDPRYEVIAGDGRQFLEQTDQRFDIIESDAVHAFASGSGTLFSREFYILMRDHLAAGGLVSHWGAHAPFAETTFLSVFPYVVQIDHNLMLGSNDPIPFDRAQLLARLDQPAVADYLEASGADLEHVRIFIAQGQLRVWGPDDPRAEGPINTDLLPRDEYYLNNRPQLGN